MEDTGFWFCSGCFKYFKTRDTNLMSGSSTIKLTVIHHENIQNPFLLVAIFFSHSDHFVLGSQG